MQDRCGEEHSPHRGGKSAYRQNVLPTEGRLSAGQALWSLNNQYKAVMQGDGNFVLYTAAGVAQFATGTAGKAGAYVRMQGDGNLVVYTAAAAAKWSSDTAPASNAVLVMQDDGNLVLYSRGGVPLWASRGGKSAYRQNVLPTEGRLSAGQALWSLNNQYKAVMQGDGNFVLYTAAGAAQFATGTAGNAALTCGCRATGTWWSTAQQAAPSGPATQPQAATTGS